VAVRTPARRTQAERRAASRIRLLDATLACLAEKGYAGTTFPAVLERAGLSNGAMWRHFRSRTDLLAAAAIHSEEWLVEWPLPDGLDRLPADKRLDAATEQFWRYVHEPAFQALLELLRATRSDLDLAERLIEGDRLAAELYFSTFARLVGPDIAARPDFERNARFLGLTLYGVGLTAGLRSAKDEKRLFGEFKAMVRLVFS
jgi:AcrR family transcriptional regulator